MALRREILGAFRLGIANHLARPRHLLLIASGFLIAGLTLMVLLAIPAGLERLGGQTGRDDIAIVFSASAQDEAGSTLKPDVAALVGDLPGIRHDVDGCPLVAPQFLANVKLRRPDGTLATVLLRGITQMTRQLLGDTPLQSIGAPFGSGINELVAGATAARSFIALDPGAQIKVHESVWRVSGQFDGGGLWGSELWADIAPLQATFNAPSALSVLWVKLDSPAAFATFDAALNTDKRLHDLRAEPQRAYYARQVRFITYFVRIAAIGIALTLAFGAILAISNALTLALIARRRELAVLRALGFSDTALMLVLLIEIMLIAAITTTVTIAAGWLILNGMQVGSSTGNQAIGFTLAVTPEVMAWTLAYALLLGVTSALVPARKAVRVPLIAALGGD